MITKNDIQIRQELPFSIHSQLSSDNLCEIPSKGIHRTSNYRGNKTNYEEGCREIQSRDYQSGIRPRPHSHSFQSTATNRIDKTNKLLERGFFKDTISEISKDKREILEWTPLVSELLPHNNRAGNIRPIEKVCGKSGEAKMTTTYKFRLYPKKAEQEKLEIAKEVCRQTYNHLLAELNEGFTKNEIQNYLLDLKVVNPEMNEVHSKVLQMENQRLFGNLSSLAHLKKKGKKVGALRFKGKNWFKTFTYNQSGFSLTHLKAKKGILWLSKIGDIPIKLHRQVEGNIKSITIKKSLGKWYASIVTDAVIKRVCGTGEIGIDVGIENYIYDSKGNVYENPKHFDKYHQDLKIAQQSLSRKEKRSISRLKARFKVAKIHEKIANARDDFIHKLSTKLIRENKFIALEKLNIKNLMGISYNAKNIADASWGKLSLYLHYKAVSASCVVQDVDPAYTTRDCNFCGHRNRKLFLWQRKFCCEKCSKELNRDYNSALNILDRGKELASLEKASNTEQLVQQEVSMNAEATPFRAG